MMNSIPVRSIVNEAPVVAIVRRPKVDPVRCIEHLFQAGIRLVEITMDTAGAVDILKWLQPRVPANALLGAGTVTDVARAEAALAAGATFLVTPNLNLEVIRTARAQGVPIMPGAMTPTEIWNAAVAGADYVDALGVGGALIPKSNDEFDRCAEIAQRLLAIVREARASR
jgi:2-dehydro-3-deoxyphosphogluconate aldolase/(4S)-4-hydroxy-2-oxoglutarate aldolase